MPGTIQDAIDEYHRREPPHEKLKRWDTWLNGSYVAALASQYAMQVKFLNAVLDAGGNGMDVVEKMRELERTIEGVIYQQSIARRTFWLSILSLATSIAAFVVTFMRFKSGN